MMAATLNAGQRAALESVARRIVVSAGAGSGKTRVLAERFVERVLCEERSGAVTPMRSVLLITFTDKAAGELSERVRRSFLERGRPDLAREVGSAWISTIHGFCARIVRRHALELEVDPGFAVLADPRSGVARFESFERAAVRLLAEPDLALVIEQRGVERLRDSVLSAFDAVRAKGACVEDVRPAPAPEIHELLQYLMEALDGVLPSYRALPETATVAANLDAFARLRSCVPPLMVRARAAGPIGDPDMARDIAALADHKGRCQGGQEMKELTRTVNDALGAVAQAALDIEASHWSAAWCRLLRAFDEEYAAAKRAEGALDFEDLQLLTRRLWQERPAAAARYSRQFSEVMIDEFQDTNRLQIQAIEPVAGAGLCVVGDVQQSIYRFRDADVALFQERQTLAEAGGEDDEGCRLTVNYRSDQRLLATLNTIFGAPGFFGTDYLHLGHEVSRPSGVAWPEGAPRVEVLVADKDSCASGEWRDLEARALARRLRELVDQGRARAGDMVVLVRSTKTMRPYVRALGDVGFEVLASAAGGFYGTAAVSDVRALLRVLANPRDGQGVLGLLAGGLGGLSDDALYLLATARPDHDLWAALGDASTLTAVPCDAERAVLVRETIERLRELQGRMRLADAILHAGAVLGSGGGLLSDPDGWANLQKAARLAAEVEQTTPADPAAFLRHLDERETFVVRESVAGLSVEGGDAVRVMSVHAAKGLEFPIVAVADLGHGQVTKKRDVLLAESADGLVAAARGPELKADKTARASAWQKAAAEADALDLAEAKRVLYVACTRAEQALVLTGSLDLSKPGAGDSAIEWLLEATAGGSAEGVSLTVVDPESEPAAPPASRVARPPAGTQREVEHPSVVLREAGPIAAPTEISYTALAQFDACAYRFFAERMLKVGAVVVKREDDPRTFGVALHGALELLARGEEVGTARLAALASSMRLSVDELPRLEGAVSAVRGSAAGELLSRGRPEVAFALPVEGGVVRGSMDLLVRDGSSATVLDYKTGRTWDAKGGRYAAQAEVYALALLEAGAEAVEVRFVHVEAGCEEAVFRFGPGDRPAIRARIERAFARMSAGEFPILSAFDPVQCDDCPVSGSLCPVVHPKGRAKSAR